MYVFDVRKVVQVPVLADDQEPGRDAGSLVRGAGRGLPWAVRVHELGQVGRRPWRWISSNWPGGSRGPSRWHRGQRTQRGNGVIGTPTWRSGMLKIPQVISSEAQARTA